MLLVFLVFLKDARVGVFDSNLVLSTSGEVYLQEVAPFRKRGALVCPMLSLVCPMLSLGPGTQLFGVTNAMRNLCAVFLLFLIRNRLVLPFGTGYHDLLFSHYDLISPSRLIPFGMGWSMVWLF